MPLYLVMGRDREPGVPEKRGAFRPVHQAYITANQSQIAMIGALVDDAGQSCGSFYIFEAESEQAVRDWLKGEPYVQNGVYHEMTVEPILVGKNTLPPRQFAAGRK